MLSSSWAHVPQLLSPCSRACQTQIMMLAHPRAHTPWSLCYKKRAAPSTRSLYTATREWPLSPQLEKKSSSKEDPAQTKIK